MWDVLAMASRRKLRPGKSSAKPRLHRSSCTPEACNPPSRQPLNAATMALPLRCARSRAAMPAQLRSIRVSPFSTSTSRPAGRINHDVRITRYGGCSTYERQNADACAGPASPF